ncbi:XisH family protein [Okeania sp.]|uniref:XisH family protein n=1 Tax=Okeania sp. TaxID=3100323 RepID=UPI002B4B74CA|nr:XisH family protein [Okeania sp.]MEB3339951.1 XisH family protein [Okeania sp.]
MSARDAFHTVVKNALIKEGWRITHDPYSIRFGGVNMSIDLGSQKLIAAENSQRKIAVEIKSFLPQSSARYEFHTALGQYMIYHKALTKKAPERTLYLAIPTVTYNTFFQLELPRIMIE